MTQNQSAREAVAEHLLSQAARYYMLVREYPRGRGVELWFAMAEEYRALAALRLSSGGQGWQDIATAPKDGTEVLVEVRPKVIRLGWYFKRSSRTEGWCDESGKSINPMRWAPLPSNHPQQQGEKP